MLFSNNQERIVIDVGTGFTKVLVGSSSGKKKKNGLLQENVKVTDAFILDTPKSKNSELDEIIGDDRFSPYFDSLKLIKEIKEKLKVKKIKADQVIVTIGDKSVIAREMILPKVDEEKLKGIIRFELQEFLPIDPKRYLINFKIMDEIKVEEVEKYKLNVAALPKDEGQFYHNFVNELGKDPFALDIYSNGISKLFGQNMKINGKIQSIETSTFAYVDIGYSNIKIHIIEKGNLKFTRNLEGGLQFLSSDEAGRIQETVESVELIDKWISSLEQIIKFYTSRENNRQIDCFFIYGGGSKIPKIEKQFTELTGIPAEVMEGLDIISINKESEEFSLPLYLNAVASLIRK